MQAFLALVLVFVGTMSSQVAASATTIKPLPQVWALSDFEGTLLDAAFSVDDTKLVTANGSSKIQIWKTATGSLDIELDMPDDLAVEKVAYSPDGSKIAVANAAHPSGLFIYLIDTKTGRVVHTLTIAEKLASLTDMIFNETGDVLYSATDADNGVAIWNVNTGKVIGKFSLGQKPISLAYLAKTNQLAVAIENGSVSVRNALNGQYLHEIANYTGSVNVKKIDYNKKNQLLFGMNHDDSLYVRTELNLDEETVAQLKLQDSEKTFEWADFSLRHDGRFVAGAFHQSSNTHDRINIIDIYTGKVVAKASTQAQLLQFNNDGSRLLAGTVLYDTSKLPENIQTGITAQAEKTLLKVGERLDLSVFKVFNDKTKMPLDSENYTIVSSNPAVMSLSFGKMEAKAEGKTTLTITSGSYKTTVDIVVNNYKEHPEQVNKEPNKVWTVTFNDMVSTASVTNNTMYVLNEKGEKVAVTYTVDKTKVKVQPVKNYTSGETYTLWVKDVKSTTGKIIGKYETLKFTIK